MPDTKQPFTGINSFYPHKIPNEEGKNIILILEMRQTQNTVFVIKLAPVSQLGSSGTWN